MHLLDEEYLNSVPYTGEDFVMADDSSSDDGGKFTHLVPQRKRVLIPEYKLKEGADLENDIRKHLNIDFDANDEARSSIYMS